MNDKYLDLTAAAKLAPGRPHTASIWRWCRRGVKSRGGARIRLQHIRAGGKLYTSAAWLTAFFAATAAADAAHFDVDPPTPSKAPSDRHRAKSVARAEKVLAEAGIA